MAELYDTTHVSIPPDHSAAEIRFYKADGHYWPVKIRRSEAAKLINQLRKALDDDWSKQIIEREAWLNESESRSSS